MKCSGILLLAAIATPAAAQQHDQHASPYAGAMEQREIKALSADELRALRAGEGMGFALAAELNGYPGPRHVLDLAEPLGLTATQRAETQRIFDGMSTEARRLGAEIVDAERALDAAFAEGGATKSRVGELTTRIGELTGRLRSTHLAAHVEVNALLSEHQRREYARLRGYGAQHAH